MLTSTNKSGDTFYEMTNPVGADRTYNGFQVNVRKRFSHNWQTSTSYTWSRTRGNVNNNFGANAVGSSSTSDTGQGGVFANPNRAINSYGPVVFDYTHHFKAEGTYRLPLWGGFNFSGVYRYITGAAWGRRAGIRGLDQVPRRSGSNREGRGGSMRQQLRLPCREDLHLVNSPARRRVR